MGAGCTWTAPGDDNLDGAVDRYEMRYWTGSDNANSRVVDYAPNTIGGTTEALTISDLEENKLYYFNCSG